MKTLFSTLTFLFFSIFAIAQDAEESETPSTPKSTYKYFISTNSGLAKTPFGFRIGILEKMGGYVGMRFGKGYKYEDDVYHGVQATKATLFAADAGLIFPIAIKHKFKVHTFVGVGYGKWFDRPSQSGQTVGIEAEGGLMLSYQSLMINLGGIVLTGDGNPAKGDMTVGIGFRF